MKYRGMAGVTICLLLPSYCCAKELPANIILINVDDLGWSDLSFNASNYYETPNIDRLKSSGVWFTDSYASAANSAPSRACMLTGQYTPRHGVYTVGEPNRGRVEQRKLIAVPNSKSLPDNFQILPQVLKDAGYNTCHIGKWHITADPTESGIDVNIGGNSIGLPRSYFSPYKNKNLSDGKDGEYLVDRLANEAISYLNDVDKSLPFFLYYAPYGVHTPLQAPRELIDKYEGKSPTKAHNNAVYAAMIESVDSNIGRILSTLKELGLDDNTMVVFTSDNGGVYNISKQWPLRAGKGSFYEGGVRVPMIIYQKGRFQNREISNIAVSQIDLFPTFLDIAHVERDDIALDGVSLVPILDGNGEYLENRPLFWHFPAYLQGGNGETTDPVFRSRPVSVVRQGDWKLIKNYESSTVELFNIKDDIGEKMELSDKYPQKVDKLTQILERWLSDVAAPIPTKLNSKYKK